MELPNARGFMPLAWQFAKSGNLTPIIEVERALAAAAIDAGAAAAAVAAASAERQATTIH